MHFANILIVRNVRYFLNNLFCLKNHVFRKCTMFTQRDHDQLFIRNSNLFYNSSAIVSNMSIILTIKSK